MESETDEPLESVQKTKYVVSGRGDVRHSFTLILAYIVVVFFLLPEDGEVRPRSQRKELIDFNNFDECAIFEDEAQLPLTVTGTTHRDKFLITPITHFNLKNFFR